MIVRSGQPSSILILLPSGTPDGDINWTLIGADGTTLASGTEAVPSDAVSINLVTTADLNTLGPASLSGARYVLWDYTVSGVIFTGEKQYQIEQRPPFGASPDGVRAKLGALPSDLPDDQISLIGAYRGFRALAGSDNISTGSADEDTVELMRQAIEASAALALIPTMPIRMAQSEDSGTSAFKRQQIDWGMVADTLAATVDAGIIAVFPAYDPTATLGAIFLLASPATDAITGA